MSAVTNGKVPRLLGCGRGKGSLGRFVGIPLSRGLTCYFNSPTLALVCAVAAALLVCFCAGIIKVSTNTMKVVVLLSHIFSKFSSILVKAVVSQARSGCKGTEV